MTTIRNLLVVFLLLASSVGAREISVSGTHFELDGKPFPYTGLSFFNAIYNPAFNKSSEARLAWLHKFQKYGINVLRVWVQWDNKRGFADAGPEATFYFPDGRLRQNHVDRFKQILSDADREGMVVELTLFSQESWRENVRLDPPAADKAVAALTRELVPFRNVTFQIWNEFSERVVEHVKTIKSIDPKRLVTNSPGFGGVMGDPEHLKALDYLTPHTSRQIIGKTWVIAPAEIAYQIARWRKPVVDDEPARNGTPEFGGPKVPTLPADHIVHIYNVWRAGGYITYHHDMFQTGYGSPSVPPSGVPDPEFNPYHRTVLEFIALRGRYAP